MLGVIPKFIRIMSVSFGLLSEDAKLPYGSAEKTLIETMQLCDLLQCDDCTCTA